MKELISEEGASSLWEQGIPLRCGSLGKAGNDLNLI
jgi:hypothetical protein